MTNYPTRSFLLWIDNDNEFRNKIIENALKSNEPEDALTDLLKDSIQQSIPPGIEGVYLDLLQNAINSINFREIAESLLSE